MKQPEGALARLAGLDLTAKLIPALGAALTIGLIGVPLAMLVYAALRGPSDFLPFEDGAHYTLDNLRGLISDPTLVTRILPDTLVFVAGTVCLTTIIAFALAWLVERTDMPGRNVWFALIVAPLLVPVPVIAIAWIMLFGPNAGWANQFIRTLFGMTGEGPLNVFSMGGLIACQSVVSAPFVFLQICAALRGMSPVLEEAAAMAGAGTLTAFRRITLPVLLPGLLAPIILVTLVTFEQFELPLIIGLPAKVNIFAFRIYTELNPASGLPDYGAACAISLPFLLLGVLSLGLYNRATRRAERFVTVTGKATAQRRLTLGAWKRPALVLLCAYVAIAALLPLLTLIWTSLFGYAPPGRVSLAEANIAPYRNFLTDPTLWRALGNTLVVATLSALLVTGLGGLIAWIVARSTMPGRRLLDVLSFMSLGIPAVIAGLAVMVLYLSLPIGIYGTIWILVIAYSYRLATTTRLAKSSLMQIHRELEEAAEMSGARWLATQLRILIPLLTPALGSAFLVAFIIALREFTIPFILYSSENLVLPVLVWQLFQNGEPARSAALGVLMIVVILPGILALRLFLVRGK